MLLLIATLALSDVQVISRTLYAEAGGEGERGIVAVAGVISNRSKLQRKSLRAVCLQRKQFSCWNGGTIPRPKMNKTYAQCIVLAQRLTKQPQPSRFTHYYAHRVCNPRWAAELKNKTVIGNHTFGTI